MDNEYNLYSTEESISNNLSEISMRIEECISNLKLDFENIGTTGDVWNGNVANVAKETFEDLSTKYFSFKETERKYFEYLDKK